MMHNGWYCPAAVVVHHNWDDHRIVNCSMITPSITELRLYGYDQKHPHYNSHSHFQEIIFANKYKQCRLDTRKYSFSQRVITEWNKLSNDCVNARNVNMFKNRIDRYMIRVGYT